MNEIIKLGLTLMVVTLIASTGLALANYYTAPKIEKQKELAIKEALNKVIQAESFEERDNYYNAYKEEKLTGRVLKIESQGYSSIINALVGIDLENKITGIDIISQQETPGLGANIEKESFLHQFIGKTEDVMKIKKDGGEIDGVTGATISSRAIVDGIRDIMEKCPCDATTSASPKLSTTEEELDETDPGKEIYGEISDIEKELNESAIEEISIIDLDFMKENETE